jgi:DNA helicase-2/ATP-dependent DNA helicase PcrA
MPASTLLRSNLYRVKKAERGTHGFSSGDKVSHPAFGPGVVSRFIADDKVEVLFRNVGRKLLHMEYTTLEKV